MNPKTFKQVISSSHVERKQPEIKKYTQFKRGKLSEQGVLTKQTVEEFINEQLNLPDNSVRITEHAFSYFSSSVDPNRQITAKDLNVFFDAVTEQQRNEIKTTLLSMTPVNDDTTMSAVIIRTKNVVSKTLPFSFGIIIVPKQNKRVRQEKVEIIYLITTIIKNPDKASRIKASTKINNQQTIKDKEIIIENTNKKDKNNEII